MGKDRTLCEWLDKYDLKKHLEAYRELVRDPRFLCKKCGRVARREAHLCKPENL